MEVEINIAKWKQYNPKEFRRRNAKWFRLDREITRSETLFNLTAEEKWVWVTLMCVACQRGSGFYTVNIKYLSREADSDENIVLETIRKLKLGGALLESDTKVVSRLPQKMLPTEQNITIQNRTEEAVVEKTKEDPRSVSRNASASVIIPEFTDPVAVSLLQQLGVSERTQRLWLSNAKNNAKWLETQIRLCYQHFHDSPTKVNFKVKMNSWIIRKIEDEQKAQLTGYRQKNVMKASAP